MNEGRELHLMKSMQEMIVKFGKGVPQSEKDFLDGIIQKLEKGVELEPKEKEFVDKNMKAVFD